MNRRAVFTGVESPAAIVSPAVVFGGLVFVCGQVPMDRQTRTLIEGTFEDRVRQCLRNCDDILKAAGTGLEAALKVTVFLTDLNNLGELNRIWGQFWDEVKPVRTCVEVRRLPMDADVEIEVIAGLPEEEAQAG